MVFNNFDLPHSNNSNMDIDMTNEKFDYKHKERSHYYNLENSQAPKNFSCTICNKDFYSHHQYKKHVDNHESCPFPECYFKADIKKIDQHISHQHMMINFEELQIDDGAWIENRKKRFPSLQRAELRREQQLVRLKRGERLGKDNRKFPMNKKNNFNRNKPQEKAEYTKGDDKRKNFRKHTKEKYTPKQKIEHKPKVMEYDSDLEIRQDIPAFKGVNNLLEDTGEVSMFGIKQNIHNSSQNELHISDEEEWNNSESIEPVPVQNALGSLMGAYNSESDTEDKNLVKNVAAVSVSEIKTEVDSTLEVSNVSNQTDSMVKNSLNSNPNNCAQNDVNSIKKSDSNERGKNRRKRKHNSSNNGKNSNTNRQTKRSRRTLLEKLLEPNIVHERNVILQCVRYVVQNNYFDESR